MSTSKDIWFTCVKEYENDKEQCMNQLKSLLTDVHEIIASSQYTFQQFTQAIESKNSILNSQIAPILDICLRQLLRQSPIYLVQLVLDYAIYLASISFIEDSIPLILLEDIMECSSFEQCKSTLFNILEDRRQVLTKDMVPNKGKALVILRICNELLKRASKSIDGPFCGRIVFFLSTTFSLTERSAVNLRGHFNIYNVTHIDPPYSDEQGVPDLDRILREDNSSIQLGYDLKMIIKDLDNTKSPIPYSFYQVFWHFQSFCANPSTILSNSHWLLFSSIIVDIVFLIEYCISQRLERQLLNHGLMVKLLSSRQLLKYQLKDPMFLLQLLVQILIILGYLEQQLSNEDQDDKQKMKIDFIAHGKEKCLSLLDAFNSSCSTAVQIVLKEEEEWVHWKKEGCIPFERDHVDVTFEYIPKPILLDTMDLDMQVDKDMTEMLSGRVSEPKLSEYLDPFKEQLDPTEQIEKEYRLDRDPVYVWKAFRLASRQDTPAIIEACKKMNEEDELVQLVKVSSLTATDT